MKSTCKYIGVKYLFILVGLLFCSCNQLPEDKSNYQKDSAISDIHGKPHDSLTFYFPTSIKKDSQIVKVEMEDFMNEHFSSSLYFAHEPVLCNYYLGHEVYRFLWLRSFNKPIVFSLNRERDIVWLNITVLDKMTGGLLPPEVYTGPANLRKPKALSLQQIRELKVFQDSVAKANSRANIVFKETRQLTTKEWVEFETLLKKCAFWKTKPYEFEVGIDGSRWTIEAHHKNQYWFVSKYCPKGNFYSAGKYLIVLAGLTESSFEY